MSTYFHYEERPEGFGMVHNFDHAGDTVPMHDHIGATRHFVRCERGKVRILTPTGVEVLGPGEELDVTERNPHEFIAAEDNTQTFNRLPYASPERVALLRDEQGKYVLEETDSMRAWSIENNGGDL
jgi:hypothetical protein